MISRWSPPAALPSIAVMSLTAGPARQIGTNPQNDSCETRTYRIPGLPRASTTIGGFNFANGCGDPTGFRVPEGARAELFSALRKLR
jgi:hypothetical protein